MENLRKTIKNNLRVENQLAKELLGEFFGTAFLLLIGLGINAQFELGDTIRYAWINVNVGWGLAVTFAVYICGTVSGGHVNPAITVMHYTLGNISFVKMLLYCVTQTFGAFIGAALVFATYYDKISEFDGGVRAVYGKTKTAGIFGTFPPDYLSVWGGLLDQMVGTGILGGCALAVIDKRNKVPDYLHAFIIGYIVTMIGTCYGLNCGYPINPARDLGPRIFTLVAGYGWDVFSFNNYKWFWIPIVGPTLGAVFGGCLYKLFIGIHGVSERHSSNPHDEYQETPLNI